MWKNSVSWLVVCSFLSLSSCAITQKLDNKRSYVEKVSSILVSEDHKKLIFASQKYHYIFDAPQSIIWTLGSNFTENLKTAFYDFEIDNSNMVTGKVHLSLLNTALDEGTKEQARSSGFERHGNYFSLSEEMNGIRYVANGTIRELYAHKFRETYEVNIVESDSGLPTPVKALLTPITVAADLTVGIGIIVLVPIALVLHDIDNALRSL